MEPRWRSQARMRHGTHCAQHYIACMNVFTLPARQRSHRMLNETISNHTRKVPRASASPMTRVWQAIDSGKARTRACPLCVKAWKSRSIVSNPFKYWTGEVPWRWRVSSSCFNAGAQCGFATEAAHQFASAQANQTKARKTRAPSIARPDFMRQSPSNHNTHVRSLKRSNNLLVLDAAPLRSEGEPAS